MATPISGPPVCPSCGASTKARSTREGALRRVCPQCGWGLELLSATQAELDAAAAPVPPSPLVLTVYWVVTGMVFAVPISLIVTVPAHTLAIVMGFVIYLAASNVLSPRWDPNNLGLFGGLINNPFTYEDNWNRAMLQLNLMFIPGKIVGRAVMGTLRVLKARQP